MDQSTDSKAGNEPGGAPTTIGQVIVVDDNPDNLRTLKTILEEHGYESRVAISGLLAIEAIQKVKPDLILLDIMMPEMDGYEVCNRLKAMPDVCDIPVLFISALDGAIDKIKAFEVGGVDYISKPFHVSEVIARVQAHISLSKTRIELEKTVASLQKHSDELETVNSELAAFSYSVSHDLRAPLRAVSGYSELLEEDYGHVLDDQCKSYLGKIKNGVGRMGQLIDDILQLSKISTAELIRHKVDMSALTSDVIEKLKEQPDSKDTKVVIEPDMVSFSDGRLVAIVYANLIGNAWKYTRKTDNPAIETGSVMRENKKAFFVRDNGPGFDMKYADAIFTPFKRLYAEAEYEGSGIGLATVARIVQRHNGKIWAESRPGEGSVFYFVIE